MAVLFKGMQLCLEGGRIVGDGYHIIRVEEHEHRHTKQIRDLALPI